MKKRTGLFTLISGVVAILLCSAVSAAKPSKDDAPDPDDARFSGYLPDYTQLKEVKDPLGNKLLRWVSPRYKPGSYPSVIVDDVVFYPKPESSDQVSLAALEEIRGYLTDALRKELGRGLTLATSPGPGVSRLKVAITAVATSADLKAKDLLPIGLVKMGVQKVTGGRDREVKIFVELQMVDSANDKVLGLAVREGSAAELENESEQLTLAHMKPKIDQWAKGVRLSLEAHGNK